MAKSVLAKSVFLVGGLSLISRLLGFVREMVFAAVYGTSYSMDAYVVASMIPVLLGSFVQVGISSAFIPVYNSYLAKDERESAKAMGNTMFGIVTLITSIVVLIGLITAPQIVSFVAPGFAVEQQIIAVTLTRFMMPIILLSGWLGLFCAIQEAHQRFFYSAFGNIPMNIVIVLMVIFLSAKYGVFVAGLATTVATAVQVVIQVPGLVKCGYIPRLSLRLEHPGVRKIAILFLPMSLSMVATQVNVLVDRMIASALGEGSIAALTYAVRINNVFILLVVSSIITVVYPLLSQAIGKRDFEEYKTRLNSSIRLVMFFMIPISLVLIVFRTQFVSIVFERGAFDANATEATAFALMFFAMGMLGTSLIDLLNKAFYANHDTKTPVKVTFIIVILNIILNFVLSRFLSYGGIALATSVSTTTGTLLLLLYLRKAFGGIGGRQILESFCKTIAASVSMVVIAQVVYNSLQNNAFLGEPFRLREYICMITALFFGVGGFVFFSFLLKNEEMLQGWQLFRRLLSRIGKNKAS